MNYKIILPEAASCRRLGRDFFVRDGITVARELLGKILVHETRLGTIRGVITETESYMGEEDKGSHTFGGKRTERTEPMYHAGGTSYVYLIYGMYSCMNIAAMTEGIPQAALLRKVEPADVPSRERMEQLRFEHIRSKRLQARQSQDRQSQAEQSQFRQSQAEQSQFQLSQSQQLQARRPQAAVLADVEKKKTGALPSYKKHLADGPGKLCIAMGITRADNDVDLVTSPDFYVTEGILVLPEQIREGRRIGIDYAEEAAEYLWRFYL